MVRVFDLFYRRWMGARTRAAASITSTCCLPPATSTLAQVTGATADGRRAGQPLSEGVSPVQGADRRGPTAVIRSVAKMDHARTGGTLLNQKFSPALLQGRGWAERPGSAGAQLL
jgi:trans-4-hydroxy-L-proline dehydratase